MYGRTITTVLAVFVLAAMIAIAITPANVNAAPSRPSEGMGANKVYGTVEDVINIKPISGANVSCYHTDTLMACKGSPQKTDPEGKFYYFLTKDNYTFIATSERYLDNDTAYLYKTDPRWNSTDDINMGYMRLIPKPLIKGKTTDLDTGGALGNVNITVTNDVTGKASYVNSANQTGEFSFNSELTSYTLTLRKDGYYDKEAKVSLKFGDREVDAGNVALEAVKGKRTTIYGWVKDSTTMKPLPGAKVMVYDDEAHYSSVFSSPGNAYYFVQFTYGHIKVVAKLNGYFDKSEFIEVTKEKSIFPHNITLAPIGLLNCTIGGAVNDTSGKSLSGARVNVYDARGISDEAKHYSTYNITNLKGLYSFKVPWAQFFLVAQKQGYLNNTPMLVDMTLNMTQTINITLQDIPAMSEIKGTVFNYIEGLPFPIKSASVTLYDRVHLNTMSTFTDAAGYYNFTAYKGKFTLVADHDLEQADIAFVDATTGDQTVDLFLSKHVKDEFNTTVEFAKFPGISNVTNLKNWSNMTAYRNLSLEHDNISLRALIDRTYGMGVYGIDINDWVVDAAELNDWLEFRQFKWFGDNETSDYFTTNNTKYMREDTNIVTKNGTGNVTSKFPIDVFITMDFNTTKLKNSTSYQLATNISYDTFSTNYSSVVQLPGNYERTDTNSPFALRNYTRVIIDPKNESSGRATVSFKAQNSKVPIPKAKIWSWNDGEHSNEAHAYVKPGTNASVFIVANASKLVFSGEDSKDPVGGILKFSWSFNGTTVSKDKNATFYTGWIENKTSIHYYNESATNLTAKNNYTVLLDTMNRGLYTNETNITVVLDFVKPTPVINVTSSSDVHVNNATNGTSGPKQVWANESMKLEFNGSFSKDFTNGNDKSKDFNGTIRSWQWDFNDNLSKKAKTKSNTTNGTTVTHSFAVNGTYNVTLNVTDVAGNYAKINITVFVNDTTKPVGIIEMWQGKTNLTSNPQGIENKSYEFKGLRSYDPHFGQIKNYTWWFPDNNKKIENNTNGKSGKGIENITHNFTKTGTFKICLNMTDMRNNSQNASITVVIGKQPRPDLMVKNLTFSPDKLEEGISTIVSVNVSNMKRGTIKTANATDVTVKLLVDDVETASVKVSKELKPGEEGKATADSYETVHISWTPSKSGLHIVKVQADTPQETLANGDNKGEHPNDLADSKIQQEVNVAPSTTMTWFTYIVIAVAIIASIGLYWAWSRKKGPFSEEARTLRKKKKEEDERLRREKEDEEEAEEEEEEEEEEERPAKKEDKKPPAKKTEPSKKEK